ncbi:MAG: hypothetical protein J1F66_03670 [Clostridiales bacterium]|nr:hypothetical protein [Clostridiales bacterium]
MPYYDENVLVAADGLGGSGSAVHDIDRSNYSTKELIREDLIASAFKDATADDLNWYLDRLIEPLLDDKDDTSALWASRVVIARCVYALTRGEFKDADLASEKARKDLTDFISEGLTDVAHKFKLQNGKYDGQLLLPTTLAFIRYKDIGDSVIAETVWAGDSRCYALTLDGLKQLSVDDEDNSGSITNLFYANNKKAYLNYKCHEIKKPCVLLTVSDGVFDPFDPHDNLGVEFTLLSHIKKCTDIVDLCTKLKEFYDGVHADDATMAFVSFGFDSFQDLQHKFAARTDYILAINQKQVDMRSALEVVNQSQEEATHYVRSRTSDKFANISSVLADALVSESDGFLVTPEIKNILEAVKESRIKAAQKARQDKRDKALGELYSYVLKNPENALADIFVASDPSFNNGAHKSAYFAFRAAAKDFVNARAAVTTLESRREEYDERKSRLHEQIIVKIERYRKNFDELWYSSDNDEVLSKTRKQVLSILHQWEVIDNALRFILPLEKRLMVSQADWDFANSARNYINEYSSWCDSLEYKTRKRNICQEVYTKTWNKLHEELTRDEKLVSQLLTPDAMKMFGFDALDVPTDDGKITREEIIRELNVRKDVIVNEVVSALSAHCNERSVIDDQYNSTRLELFRTYFRLKNGSDNSVKELEQQLKELEDAYMSYIK